MTLLVTLWIVNGCTAFGFYGLSLWLPTIYNRLEENPSEPFCKSIAAKEEGTGCSIASNSAQYLDSILFAFIQLPGESILYIKNCKSNFILVV